MAFFAHSCFGFIFGNDSFLSIPTENGQHFNKQKEAERRRRLLLLVILLFIHFFRVVFMLFIKIRRRIVSFYLTEFIFRLWSFFCFSSLFFDRFNYLLNVPDLAILLESGIVFALLDTNREMNFMMSMMLVFLK